ncbi:hypothetical protein SUNI508_12191 [Seiridium unicorne]|uniref:Uncharacterized protein n=1 Tax=Seiridium unicorne TaxID=138068 RepID=A0ABR2UEP1_9PEZI
MAFLSGLQTRHGVFGSSGIVLGARPDISRTRFSSSVLEENIQYARENVEELPKGIKSALSPSPTLQEYSWKDTPDKGNLTTFTE